MKRSLVQVLAAVGCGVAVVSAQSVNEPLPPAPAGVLDIHHINTGEGAAAFLILPDTTTLLIDCGHGQDSPRPPKYKAPRKPDESRLPGEWVARYIQQVHPRGREGVIDYAVISHFHGDHMGGLVELVRHVRIGKLFDRGWPDYKEPLAFEGPLAGFYRGALREQSERHGLKVERFKAGAADQIVLLRDRARFPSFEVRNLAVNGEVWTGTGTEVRRRFTAQDKPAENPCSAALRLRYGTFDYFTGGDMPGAAAGDVPAWRDLESPVAWVTGPVDVTVLNHHGNSDGSTAFFLSVLQPRVAIAQVWASRQVDPDTWARLNSTKLYPGPRDVFTTNGMWDGRAEHIIKVFGEEAGRKHLEDLKGLAASQGHIVVRVVPGGASYSVFVLDDSDESRRVRSIHGPYASR